MTSEALSVKKTHIFPQGTSDLWSNGSIPSSILTRKANLKLQKGNRFDCILLDSGKEDGSEN